jgi:hypothetical protein
MKTILFDTCVPRPLRNCLSQHQVRRAQELNWGQLKNGELLEVADAGGIDVFITSDKNLRYQQNLARRKLAILELPTNDWKVLRQMTAEVCGAVATMQPGEYRELKSRIPLS